MLCDAPFQAMLVRGGLGYTVGLAETCLAAQWSFWGHVSRGLMCGKFHMALAWDRARPCLSGQKEGAVRIPLGSQPSPPCTSRVLLTFPPV